MVFQSTIKEEEQVVPLSAHAADDDDDLSSSLSPLPSLELEASSSSSDDIDIILSVTQKKDVSASSSNDVIPSSSMRCKSDTVSSKKNNQPPAKASSWWDSMLLNGYSFISQLTIVLVVILSWYYAHRSAVNIWQHDDMMEYEYDEEEEEEEDLSPWDIWGQGFDFDKQRDYWIADEDLPEDIATDLQSTNIAIQDEALARRQLDPLKWDTFGYWEIYHYFACDKIFATGRPVWSEQLFRDVRDFYHDFKVEDGSSSTDSADGTAIIPSTYQATDVVFDMSQNAIPYQSGGSKGRGLKAARDIQQGDVIFKQTNNTIIFNDGQTFRNFLFKMNDRFSDPGMVCDILVWAWVQDMEDNSEIPFVGVVDLDNGNLLNDFGLGDNLDVPLEELKDSVNIQCAGGGAACYASKDIAEGEELLGDYSEFVSYYSWTSMGL